MRCSDIIVERPSRGSQLEEFARFPFRVYADREAWWPPDVRNEVDLLLGRSPLSSCLEIEPFCARHGGRMVARVSAIVNHRYNDHWQEKLGHFIHFEALPEEEEAAVAMLTTAGDWLRSRGMTAIRTGFAAFLDYPYAIDSYGSLPSFLLRATPAYYHCYFKNAGFETEKGQVDYTAALSPEILQRYRGILAAAERSAVQILSWREFGFTNAIEAWTDVTNAAFARHWGWNPVTRAEVRPMLISLRDTAVADLSTIAVAGAKVVGAVFSVPDFSLNLAWVKPGAKLSPSRGGGLRGALINIGVLEEARGRGVARAAAARSFLEMAHRGMRYAGYTLVLDDNWASRRTAEGLGACVTGNFVSYRRELRARPGVNGAPQG